MVGIVLGLLTLLPHPSMICWETPKVHVLVTRAAGAALAAHEGGEITGFLSNRYVRAFHQQAINLQQAYKKVWKSIDFLLGT